MGNSAKNKGKVGSPGCHHQDHWATSHQKSPEITSYIQLRGPPPGTFRLSLSLSHFKVARLVAPAAACAVGADWWRCPLRWPFWATTGSSAPSAQRESRVFTSDGAEEWISGRRDLRPYDATMASMEFLWLACNRITRCYSCNINVVDLT